VAQEKTQLPVGLGGFGAERRAVNPHIVKVHALGINGVATDVTEHRAHHVRDRLLQQGFSSALSARFSFLFALLALLSSAPLV
jgi:hypothetical protein